MAVNISGKYVGGLNVDLTHGPSGTQLRTAAPTDNKGDGSSFYPTDLVASALASCMVTIMAIVAEQDGINFDGTAFSVEKHMQTSPRRIGALPVTIQMPTGLTDIQRKKLEQASTACPVYRSLLSDIDLKVTFVYPDA